MYGGMLLLDHALLYQYHVKQTGAENKENHQQGDIVLMYNQFLRTNIQYSLRP